MSSLRVGLTGKQPERKHNLSAVSHLYCTGVQTWPDERASTGEPGHLLVMMLKYLVRIVRVAHSSWQPGGAPQVQLKGSTVQVRAEHLKLQTKNCCLKTIFVLDKWVMLQVAGVGLQWKQSDSQSKLPTRALWLKCLFDIFDPTTIYY